MKATSDDFKDITCGACRECGSCESRGYQTCPQCRGEEQRKCYACMGEREWPCKACEGKSGGARCDRCADLRKALAKEAMRLHFRDIGRGVTTGTPDLYIGFAKASYAAGELTPKEQAA